MELTLYIGVCFLCITTIILAQVLLSTRAALRELQQAVSGLDQDRNRFSKEELPYLARNLYRLQTNVSHLYIQNQGMSTGLENEMTQQHIKNHFERLNGLIETDWLGRNIANRLSGRVALGENNDI